MMSHTGQQKSLYLPATTGLVLILAFISIVRSAAISSPVHAAEALPPGNYPPFSALNAGPNTQQKLGTLTIGPGSLTSYFCLNVDVTKKTSDTDNCISAWSQIAETTGEYIQLRSDQVYAFNPSAGLPIGDVSPAIVGDEPASYPTSQLGYINLVGMSNQLVTAKFTAPAISFCHNGTCAYSNPGLACVNNSQCNIYGTGKNEMMIGTAVYGAGFVDTAGNDQGYAGYFGGKVFVKPLTTDPTVVGKICLNGSDQTSCVTSWNSVTAQYVIRQGDNPPSPQKIGTQNVGAQITGVSIFGSAVIGPPVADGFPIAYTCGNDLCEANERPVTWPEPALRCPDDCK